MYICNIIFMSKLFYDFQKTHSTAEILPSFLQMLLLSGILIRATSTTSLVKATDQIMTARRMLSDTFKMSTAGLLLASPPTHRTPAM